MSFSFFLFSFLLLLFFDSPRSLTCIFCLPPPNHRTVPGVLVFLSLFFGFSKPSPPSPSLFLDRNGCDPFGLRVPPLVGLILSSNHFFIPPGTSILGCRAPPPSVSTFLRLAALCLLDGEAPPSPVVVCACHARSPSLLRIVPLFSLSVFLQSDLVCDQSRPFDIKGGIFILWIGSDVKTTLQCRYFTKHTLITEHYFLQPLLLHSPCFQPPVFSPRHRRHYPALFTFFVPPLRKRS